MTNDAEPIQPPAKPLEYCRLDAPFRVRWLFVIGVALVAHAAMSNLANTLLLAGHGAASVWNIATERELHHDGLSIFAVVAAGFWIAAFLIVASIAYRSGRWPIGLSIAAAVVGTITWGIPIVLTEAGGTLGLLWYAYRSVACPLLLAAKVVLELAFHLQDDLVQ